MSVPLLPSKPQRIAALKALLSGLEGKAAVAVADIGDLLRRSEALGLDAAVLQLKLTGYRAEDICKELDGQDGSTLQQDLKNAVDEALESLFSEDPAEQEEWRTSAAQALLRRDRLQSQYRAAEVLAATHDAVVSSCEALEKRMKAIDAALAPLARALVPLNEFRRSERDLLNGAERQTAWWFSARSDCDPFLEALAGKTDNPHTPKCRECLEDLDRSSIVLTPPSPHLTHDVAFELDLGALPESLEARYRKHAEACAPCKAMMKAIEAGDRAIDELVSDITATGVRAARRRDEETLEETRDFRVVLRRREGRWRLLVAPKAGVTIASAQLTLSAKRNAIAPHAVNEGLEFEIGAELPEAATMQLRLKLGNSTAALDRSYTL